MWLVLVLSKSASDYILCGRSVSVLTPLDRVLVSISRQGCILLMLGRATILAAKSKKFSPLVSRPLSLLVERLCAGSRPSRW